MSDPKSPPQPPIAIRITRPYDTEDEFLAKELDTLTRTSIVLVGAQSRPQGVVLRFELALASGAPLVRGEGRVTAFKDAYFEGLPGLTLRFTRLDSRSKALVDRAAVLREARMRPSAIPPAIPRTPPDTLHGSPAPPAVETPLSSPSPPAGIVVPSPIPPRRPTPPAPRPPTRPPPLRPSARPPHPTRRTPPPPPADPPLTLDLESTRAEAPVAKTRSERPVPPPPPVPVAVAPTPPPPAPRPVMPSSPLDLESTRAEAPKAKSQRPPSASLASSPDREGTLERLRARARGLAPEKVSAILAQGRRRG